MLEFLRHDRAGVHHLLLLYQLALEVASQLLLGQQHLLHRLALGIKLVSPGDLHVHLLKGSLIVAHQLLQVAAEIVAILPRLSDAFVQPL